MRLRTTTLASQILFAVLMIVVVTMAIGLGLYVSLARSTADANAKERASNIAASVGDMSLVASALAVGDPHGTIRGMANQVVRDTGAAYVVVIGANGLRYSHPTPALIGQRIQEPVVALDGRIHTGIDNGSLGRSANARAPIRDSTGRPIGEVSVGILETEVSARLNQVIGAVVLYTVLALAIGVLASLVLARAIKRATFGLEPAEIVALVQEREAMLHGIREGVIGFDPQGRMNFINDKARQLLALTEATIGQPLDELVSASRLHDILADVSPTIVVSDQLAFGATLALRALRRPYVSFHPGHPSAIPGHGELYGFPHLRSREFAASDRELSGLRRLCSEVSDGFTRTFNATLRELDPDADEVASAFSTTSPILTLLNYPPELGDYRRALLPPTARFIGGKTLIK